MKRREFLSALALAALGTAVPGAALARDEQVKRLVVIFLRGGLDGLSALAPVDEPEYFRWRPTISLPPPGTEGGTLPFAPGFGLHPALEPLLDLWNKGTLSFIPACGLHTPIRTHAEAQHAMESGLPSEQHNRDGWMGRLLPLLGRDAKALTLAPTPPLIGQGRPSAKNVVPTGYPPSRWPLERPKIFTSFDSIYRGGDAISRAYHQSQIVLRNKLTEMDREISVSAAGAPSVHALPTLGPQIADYLVKSPSTRLLFAALGGFDSHFQQGTAKGLLAEAFDSLGKGVAALAKSLGSMLESTVVLFMSEFGRSLRENEFGGTENGHGGLFMLMGGDSIGGTLHGSWPGLAPEKLSDGLDLAVTVDFREVLAQIVMHHFELDQTAVAQVVPGYKPSSDQARLFRTS